MSPDQVETIRALARGEPMDVPDDRHANLTRRIATPPQISLLAAAVLEMLGEGVADVTAQPCFVGQDPLRS